MSQNFWQLISDWQSHTDVLEIQVLGARCIRVLRDAKPDEIHPSPFATPQDALVDIQDYVWSQHHRLDVLSPEVGGVTAEGWRWHVVIPPLAGDGVVFMLRRQRFHLLNLSSFADPAGSLPRVCQHLNDRKPLLICGPTGSGKTSLLVALLRQLAMTERLVLLETVREIPTLSPCWTSLVMQPSYPEKALNAALRLSPERFVLGEIREGDMPAFVTSCLLGHGGSLATTHAGSVAQIQRRFGPALVQLPDPENLGLLFVERRGKPMIVGWESLLSSTQPSF